LKSNQPNLQWRAAQVLATASQNNPSVQQTCSELEVIQILTQCLVGASSSSSSPSSSSSEPLSSSSLSSSLSASSSSLSQSPMEDVQNQTDMDQVMTKCIFAICSLVNHHPTNEKIFMANSGLKIVIEILNGNKSIKTKKKCVSLLLYLLKTSSDYKDQARRLGVVQAAISNIGCNDIDLRESTVKILLELVRPGGVEVLKMKKHKKFLLPALASRLASMPVDEEEFQTERELIQELSDLLTSKNESISDPSRNTKANAPTTSQSSSTSSKKKKKGKKH